ncbi:DUF427 domain-containing protein [Microbacterium mangrovi]|uniref:DUF427 domain-containing protein n=1 Tax=Microbacterium mangrovi TaxID=1348253 RepID=UPI00068DE36D|nr:DUF427 domain-containing protein [Microbacterium mangrovi]
MPTIQQERPTPAGQIQITPFTGTVTVRRGSEQVAASSRASVLRERNHADRYYLPREDVRLDLLQSIDQSSFCPWKGSASDYWAFAGDESSDPIAWSYPEPFESVATIEGLISFYDEKVDVVVTPAEPSPDLVHLASSPVPVRVSHGDVVLAASDRVIELHEVDVPTRAYFPRDDVRLDLLVPLDSTSFCPFKGVASEYWALAGDPQARPVAWSYPDPFPAFEPIAGFIAFYDWVSITPDE